jgi:hypothetical protein
LEDGWMDVWMYGCLYSKIYIAMSSDQKTPPGYKTTTTKQYREYKYDMKTFEMNDMVYDNT